MKEKFNNFETGKTPEEEKKRQLLNDYDLLLSSEGTEHRERSDRFYRESGPIRVGVSNFMESTGAVASEAPELKEVDNGPFLVIERDNHYYLLPDYDLSLNRYWLPSLKGCFDIESIGEASGRTRIRLKSVEKPAVCTKSSQGWALEEKGKLIIEWE